MEEIEQFLKKENYQSIRIDGDVSIENRKKKVDDFQN
jgi:SNF2 family DNA or RNA helicase